MSLHLWLGRHSPDLRSSHWDRGRFVSCCETCGQAMIKPPGLGWRLDPAAGN
jgi:hypothetical protein